MNLGKLVEIPDCQQSGGSQNAAIHRLTPPPPSLFKNCGKTDPHSLRAHAHRRGMEDQRHSLLRRLVPEEDALRRIADVLDEGRGTMDRRFLRGEKMLAAV